MFHWQTYSDRATKRRRWLATLFFILGLSFILLAVHGWTHSPAKSSWQPFGVALGCLGLGFGVEMGREWARWTSAALGLGVSALSILMTVLTIAEVIRSPEWGIILFTAVWVLPFTSLWIAVAVYCFHPSTRRHFAEVRQARARAVPG